MLQPIEFGKHSYQARSGHVSSQRLQNFYLEANPADAKGPVTVYGTPGLKLLTSVGSGPIRGVHAMNGRLFVVSGNKLYMVSKSLVATDLGEIKSTGNVHMIDNGTHVAIATRAEAYAANADGVFTLPETGFNGAAQQDGYGIFSQEGTEKFWVTGLDDMTTINGLDFSTADAFGDKVVGCISDHRELWLFGKGSTEVWYNAGLADFPFARAPSGFMERGCASSGSISKANNAVFWLGDDLSVYTATGYQPQIISTPAIDKLIAARADPSAATSFTYSQEGHTFYVLSFSDLTIVFDTTTGLWHERISDGLDRWRANHHAFVWNTNYVGDSVNGNVYELDLDTYTDNGDTIVREAVAPPLHGSGDRVAIYELLMDMETGVGLTTGQGSDPTLMLDWSDDGGKTWSDELTAGAGKIGEYMHRANFNRLGSFMNRQLRVRVSDPVKVAITGAFARMEKRT